MSLISVIIPCFNYGKLLAESLDSLLSQTYSNWECLIIDDGSTDNSRAVAEEYQARDARFRYTHQPNAGMSAARNAGLQVARGEYIQLLDADDLLAAGKFQRQVHFLDAHPDVDIVYGSVRYFRHEAPSVLSRSFDMRDEPWMQEISGQGEEIWRVLVENNIMAVNAPLFRASLSNKVGGLDTRLRSAEDWEFWVRCALAGARLQYDSSPDSWALVRIHGNNTTHNMDRMQRYEAQARLQLQETLRKMGAHQAMALNERAILNSEMHLARHNLITANIWQGIVGFVQMARSTGRYGYYLKSIPHCLKVRFTRIVK